jgi:hypothetical protein
VGELRSRLIFTATGWNSGHLDGCDTRIALLSTLYEQRCQGSVSKPTPQYLSWDQTPTTPHCGRDMLAGETISRSTRPRSGARGRLSRGRPAQGSRAIRRFPASYPHCPSHALLPPLLFHLARRCLSRLNCSSETRVKVTRLPGARHPGPDVDPQWFVSDVAAAICPCARAVSTAAWSTNLCRSPGRRARYLISRAPGLVAQPRGTVRTRVEWTLVCRAGVCAWPRRGRKRSGIPGGDGQRAPCLPAFRHSAHVPRGWS